MQRQVHGVMGIMKDNISKVLDRGEKLTDLQEKSGEHDTIVNTRKTLSVYIALYHILGKRCMF